MLVVCREDEIGEGDARGFSVTTAAGALSIVVAKRDGVIFVYENQCPHLGVNLDWIEDQFLSEDGAYLQCATHSALFRFDDGECVLGPYVGDRLTAVPFTVVDGHVSLMDS